MTKTYPSKVSYGLLAVVFLVFYGSLMPGLISGEFSLDSSWILGFLSAIFVVIAHMLLKTTYTIDGDKLKIKCGVFPYKPITINEIRSVAKTNSFISAPAPSFDRIEIKYGKYDVVVISPKNKIDFVNDLQKINPSIKNCLIE